LEVVSEITVILAFIVFVVPGVLELALLVSQPTDANTQDGVEIIADLVVNWWVPLALSTPLLFVAICLFLRIIGAVKVLEI